MTAEPAPSHSRALLLLPLAALVAILPLILHGCSCGHDFDFHLLNWIEAASQFSHGGLHPHWAYTPAYNAGEPRFVFYPPLSWYLGAILGLFLTHLPRIAEAAAWTATPIVFTWIALTASGLALYRLARILVPQNAALLAATLYLVNPYMLFTAYERTAYAELLAAAWIPMLFLAILRARVTIAGIALPLALLWLTNAPAAVMGSYTLAFLAILRLATTQGAPRLASKTWASRRGTNLTLAFTILAGTLLGFALAAFYILPAAMERPQVHIAMINVPGMRIQDNFLFEHTGTSSDNVAHDAVLHTASLVAMLLIVATAIVLAAIFAQRRRQESPIIEPEASAANMRRITASLTILATGILFLLLPWSQSLWKYAPQVSFLQFPWRLLAILATVLSLSVALALRRLRLRTATACIAALTLAAVLAFSADHAFRQRCYPEDTPAARLALFHSNTGTDPTDEYTPIAADNDPLTQGNPPFWLVDTSDASPTAGSTPGNTLSHFSVNAPHDEWAILNRRFYPAWRVTLIASGTARSPDSAPREDGLIAIRVPAGTSTIQLTYRHTRDQTEGKAITLIALPILLFSYRRSLFSRRRGRTAS